MPDRKRSITILRILGTILMVASLIFIGRGIYISNIDLELLTHPKIILFTLGLALVIACFAFVAALAWKYIIEMLSGCRQDYFRVASVYTHANLGKYFPGNIMHVVMRNVMGTRIEATQVEIATSTILELAFVAFTCFLWSFVLSWGDLLNLLSRYTEQSYYRITIIAVIAVSCIIIAFIVVHGKKHAAAHSAKIKGLLRVFLKCFPLYTSMFAIYGLVMIVNIAYYIPLSTSIAMHTFSSYIVSWFIGFIVIGAPGGLGIREAVFVFLMKDICSQDILLSAAVINRFITVIGDLLAALVGILLTRCKIQTS